MKKIIIATILVIFISSFGFALNPTQRITEDCGIYIEANHMNQLFNQLETYAKLFGMPIRRGQFKQMLAMNIFKSQAIPGINLSKKIGVFILFKKNNLKAKPHFVLMIPVKNWRTYRTKVLPKIKLGASTLSKRLGSYSVIASSEIGMRRFNESPRLENVKIFQEAQLSFFVNFSILGDLIGKAMTGMESKMNLGRRAGQPEAITAQVMDIYTTMLKSIVNMTAGLKIDRKGFEISYNLNTAPDSEMGKTMAKSTNGKLNSLAFLPKNAIAVTASRVDIKSIVNYYEKILLTLMDGSQQPGVKIQKELFQIIFSFMKLHFKNEMAIAMLPAANKKLAFAAVTKINNPNNALKRYEKLINKFNNSGFFKKAAQEGIKLKVRLQKEINTYYRVPSHKLSLQLALPKKMVVAGRTGKIIRILQELLSVRFFHHKGYEVMALGTDNTTTIKNLIKIAQQKKRSFLRSAAYSKIKSSYGYQSKNGLFYISTPKVATELIKFGSQFSKNKSMLQISKILSTIPLQKGGIYGYSAFKNNNSSGKIMISQQEIKNIFSLYMMFMKAEQKPAGRYNKYRR